jgi:anti-sigma regulatory factor (Ser/Thr protein kinase)
MSVQSCRTGATEHAVHFYEQDADLHETVGSFLAEALAAGGVAIAIATGPHRRGFARALDQAGFDVEEAVLGGRLVLLDAAQTLSRFAEPGRVDPAAFRLSVGHVVRGAAERGRPVHAFGEMVALLWEPGDVLGAIELEELWNGLAEEASFSLLCGYRRSAVSAPEHREALGQVCQLHTAIRTIEPEPTSPDAVEARDEFLPDPMAAREARAMLAKALAEAGCDDEGLKQDAHLVASELVTNAVVHAYSPVSVTVRCEPSRVRLEVDDFSSARPSQDTRGRVSGLGMGMELVASVSSSWGVEPARHGKTVWAELGPRQG